MTLLKVNLKSCATAFILVSLSAPAFAARSIVGTWYCTGNGIRTISTNGGSPKSTNYSYTAVRNYYRDHTNVNVVNNEASRRMGTWSQRGRSFVGFADTNAFKLETEQSCAAAGFQCTVNGLTVNYSGKMFRGNILKNKVAQTFDVTFPASGRNDYVTMNANENCHRTSNKPAPKVLASRESVGFTASTTGLAW